MVSLSDVPLPPPPPRVESSSASRSDVAPKPLPQHADVGDEELQFPPGAYSPDDAIDEQIADLERWAVASEARDRSETLRFWVLRGVAFMSASLAAASGSLGMSRGVIVLSVIAALFIAIDAAWPGANLRNPYRRAVYDLRALQNTVRLRWDKVRLAYPNPTGARRVANALALLDAIQAKREDIGKYLGSAEASPGLKRPPSQ